MKANLLLKTWNTHGTLPDTIGAGGWYDNTVRIGEDEHGKPRIEWNDEDPVWLVELESDDILGIVSDYTRSTLAPKRVAVDMFLHLCRFVALQMDNP